MQIRNDPIQNLLSYLPVPHGGIDCNEMNIIGVSQIPIIEKSRQYTIFIHSVKVHGAGIVDQFCQKRSTMKPFILGKCFPMQTDKLLRLEIITICDSSYFNHNLLTAR